LAPDEATANRNAVASFSPALSGEVGLRWVNGQNKSNSEEVVAHGGRMESGGGPPQSKTLARSR